ncbi:hypothetical protein [Rhodococcus triatomae]|nr:hypothetical protein G419_07002 [Rhodococcus triatomae BKS 15-14]
MARRGWVVLIAVCVAGCSGLPGGAEGDLSRAAGESASAVSAAQFALEQRTDLGTTRSHAVTVVSDALEGVLGAYDTVAELEVATVDESAHRATLLVRLGDAVAVLGDTRSHLDGLASAPDAAALGTDLESLAGFLSDFAEGGR